MLLALFILGTLGLHAQTSCVDLNGYVAYKNTGLTGAYTLSMGDEEMAAQTYEYDGPGKVTSVRVYGNYSGILGGVPLRVTIYNVDANGRPTTAIQSVNDTWWVWNNPGGYITVNFPGGGVFLDHDFAVGVEVRNAAPWGTSFSLQYTGDGEGLGEDHASLAGTSTGFNWSSAMTNFNKNGDFYLIPRMTHFITADFDASAICVGLASNITFTNTSSVPMAMMFNTIGLPGYGGSNEFYTWDFGDGSSLVHTANASHAYGVAGRYTVTLTTTMDGWNSDCSDTYSIDVSVGLSVFPGTVTNVTCNGGEDGGVTVARAGGASPYLVSIDGANYQTNPSFSGLSAGTYVLYVMPWVAKQLQASRSRSLVQSYLLLPRPPMQAAETLTDQFWFQLPGVSGPFNTASAKEPFNPAVLLQVSQPAPTRLPQKMPTIAPSQPPSRWKTMVAPQSQCSTGPTLAATTAAMVPFHWPQQAVLVRFLTASTMVSPISQAALSPIWARAHIISL